MTTFERDSLSLKGDVLGLDSGEGAARSVLYGTAEGSEPVEPVPAPRGDQTQEKRGLNPAVGEEMGKGRKKGQVNRLTRTMKEAIEQAFEKAGGVDYLVRLAEGTATDRQAFAALIGRLLPMQVNSNIDQRIRIELPWLQARGIGKVDAAEAGHLALVGKGRTIDAEAPGGIEENAE